MPLSGRDRTPRKEQAGKRILPVAEIRPHWKRWPCGSLDDRKVSQDEPGYRRADETP